MYKLWLFGWLLCPIFLLAQNSEMKVVPQDEQEFTADKIIRGLVNSGVEILEVSTNFGKKSHVMGFYHDPIRYMGIGQGMILSTGVVDNVATANSSEGYTSAELDMPTLKNYALAHLDSLGELASKLNIAKLATEGDEDLSKEIAGLKTYDARVIEISFIPSADTLYYRYVFASEEYDEFVCSSYNDVFAFYLSREGRKKKNIALVPGKRQPVSINTINNGNPRNPSCKKSNAHLYQKNDGRQNLLYDGFTKVLDIRQKVIPGKVYHLKIAIADASDNVLDSSVLIENGSIFSYFNFFELHFGLNSSVAANKKILRKTFQALKKHPNSKVQLIGHADLSGDATYNFELSKKRVQSIKEQLIEEGIAADRILEAYKGETMPRYEEAAKNRRVEIFILGA